MAAWGKEKLSNESFWRCKNCQQEFRGPEDLPPEQQQCENCKKTGFEQFFPQKEGQRIDIPGQEKDEEPKGVPL